MSGQAIAYFLFGVTLVILFVIIIVYYYSRKRRQSVERPKYTMLDEDD